MHTVTNPTHAWRGFFALAVLALSVLLARPVCDAFETRAAALPIGAVAVLQQGDIGAAGHSRDSDPCCAAIDNVSGMTAPDFALAEPRPPTAIWIAALVLAAWPIALPGRVALQPPQVPPRLRPFHARSARILV